MELLYRCHLLRDDVQNFATTYGIVPQGMADTYFHRATAAFAPLNLPLREIVRTDVFAPAEGSDIYIVENSGVFSSLLDALTAARRSVPLLCLHGQAKFASWALLDRLPRAARGSITRGTTTRRGLPSPRKFCVATRAPVPGTMRLRPMRRARASNSPKRV